MNFCCEIFSCGRNCVQMCKCRFSKFLSACVQKKCQKCHFFRLRRNTVVQPSMFDFQAWHCAEPHSNACSNNVFPSCVDFSGRPYIVSAVFFYEVTDKHPRNCVCIHDAVDLQDPFLVGWRVYEQTPSFSSWQPLNSAPR